MAETETVRVLRVSGRSEGLDALSASLKKVADAHAGVGKAAEGSAGAVETSAKRQLSITNAWERQAAAADKAIAAEMRLQRELKVAGNAYDAGKITITQYGAEIDRLKSKLESLGGTLASGKGTSFHIDLAFDAALANKSAADSVAAMEAEFKKLETYAQERLDRVAVKNAQVAKTIASSTMAGPPKSAEKSFEVFAAAMDKTEASVQRLTQRYDPLSAAQERHNADMREAAKLLAAGDITQKSHDTIQANSTKILADTTKAYEGAFTSQNKFAQGTGLARHEMVNFGRQAQDVFVSLASGQGVMTVLIQQGTQIYDIFASSRGTTKGILTELASTALRALPAVTALGGALGALYLAASVASEKQTLSNSLLGVGKTSGLTGGDLAQLSKEAAEAANITVSSSRVISAEFVKLGQFGAANLVKLTQVTKDLAAATGQTLPDAAKDLRQALADPERGAQALGEKLGTLDQTVVRGTRSAGTYNERLAAMKNLLDEVGRAAEGAADKSLSKLDRLWNNVKIGASNVGEGVAGLILGKDPAEKTADLRKELKGINEEVERLPKNQKIFDPQIAQLRERGKEIEKQIAAQEAGFEAERQAAAQAAERAKNNDITARADAGAKPFKTLTEDAISAGIVYKNLQEKVDQAAKAYGDSMSTLAGAGDGMGSRQAIERFGEAKEELSKYVDVTKDAKRYLDELRKAEEAGGIETYRANQASEIRNKYLGDTSAKARIAMAGELALNDAFATRSTETQRLAAAESAKNEETYRGTRALAEQETAARYNIKSTQDQTKAMEENGQVAADNARMRAEADKEAKEKGGNADAIYEIKRAEAAEALRLEMAKVNSELRERTKAETQATAAASAGNKSMVDRNALSRENLARSADERALDARGIKDTKERNRLLDEGTKLRKEELDAQKGVAALGIEQQQNQTIEALEREIELVGKSVAVRRVELEVLQAKQQLQQAGIREDSAEGKAILDRAVKIGNLNTRLAEQNRLQQGLRQSMDFAADSLKSFVEELLTGTDGINGALKALGKGFLSASLDALISGKGPLAGITGLQAADKDSQGGIIGLLTKGVAKLGSEVQKGAEVGAKKGVGDGVEALGSGNSSSILGGLGIDGKALAGGLTAIAGLAGAYGTGAAAGSYGQAVAGGAISGGVAGLAAASALGGVGLASASVLGPIGLIIGGALAYYGQKSAREAAKKAREEEAQANYKAAEPGIATLRSQLRGEAQDTLENRINNTLTEVQKGIDVAFFAKKTTEAKALADDFGTYKWKAITDFQRAFEGLTASLEDGLGPNSAFAQAREQVKATGDSLKGFISDAAYAFGAEAKEVDIAREAAKVHALSILDGSKTLSQVATRMEEIRGAGVALQTLLVELGMAATDAAKAIELDTIAALGRLKGAFTSDINSQINEASGYGYVNEFNTLFADISAKMKDAVALGLDPSNITTLFKFKAQDIVDGAELTGDAFDRLIEGFPQLAGMIHEFTGALKGVAREADIAARKLAAQDRLFAATNDTTTLEGQLRAYDRTAAREREEEIKKGGEALADLEAAQMAERLNIVKNFNDQALAAQKSALEEAKNYIQGVTRRIKEYLDGLRAGSNSPLSPQDRLAAATSQYNAQLTLAQGGDRDALGSITQYADDLLEAAKAYFASSQGFQDIFQQIQTQLGALPDMLTPEDLIVEAVDNNTTATVNAMDIMRMTLENAINSGSANAVANALSTYFTKIDTSVDGLIDFGEMQNALKGMASDSSLRDMFTRLDTDNSGALGNLELLRYSNAQIKPAVDESTRVMLLALAEISGRTGTTATYTSYLPYIGNVLANVESYSSLIRANLISANSRYYSAGSSNPVPGYATGGMIGGYGTGTSDSNLIRASRGEFMMQKSAVDAVGAGNMDYINDNHRLPSVNDPASADNSYAALEACINELTREVVTLRKDNARGQGTIVQATAQGAGFVREGLDAISGKTRGEGRAQRRDMVANG